MFIRIDESFASCGVAVLDRTVVPTLRRNRIQHPQSVDLEWTGKFWATVYFVFVVGILVILWYLLLIAFLWCQVVRLGLLLTVAVFRLLRFIHGKTITKQSYTTTILSNLTVQTIQKQTCRCLKTLPHLQSTMNPSICSPASVVRGTSNSLYFL